MQPRIFGVFETAKVTTIVQNHDMHRASVRFQQFRVLREQTGCYKILPPTHGLFLHQPFMCHRPFMFLNGLSSHHPASRSAFRHPVSHSLVYQMLPLHVSVNAAKSFKLKLDLSGLFFKKEILAFFLFF